MDRLKKIKVKMLVKYFFMMFIPLFLILTISLYAIFKIEVENKKDIVKIKEKSYVRVLKQDIEAEISSIISDVKVIRDSKELNTYIDSPIDKNLEDLNLMFQRFFKNKKMYNEMTLVGEEGKEICKVKRISDTACIIPKNLLGNQKEDYNFKKTMNLERYIYTSYTSFQWDNDGQTVMCFGTPIFNEKQEKIGILFFKYDARNIIRKIRRSSENEDNIEFTLLDKNNAYIDSDKKGLSQKYRDVFYTMKLKDNEYIENEQGIYYFENIYPFNIIRIDNYWKVVAFYPLDKLASIKNTSFKSMVVMGEVCSILIMIVCLISSYIACKRKQVSNRLNIYVSIFENSKEAILITDKETKILYVNKSFLDITGYSEKEVIGKKTSFFKSGRHDKQFYQAMWKDIKEGGRWQGEIWDKRKGNRIYLKFLTIISIKDDYGVESGYVGIFEDLTDLKDKEESINKLQNYDVLTALPNLILIKKLISETMESNALDYKDKLYLIALSIDNYNNLKDSLGLRKIDDLIIETVGRLKENINKEVILSRTDKDEFMIFISDFKEKQLNKFINKILEILKAPFIIDNEVVYLKVSMGICTFNKKETNLDSLIENANMARNYALEEQCNFIFYKDGLREEFIRKVKMENALRNVLQNQEIYLNYQPQVEISTGKISGAEALLRWKSPEFGNVSPVKFIPIAEKNGAIIPIGEWVLNEACKRANIWRKEYFEDFCMAVNISPIQFKDTNVFEIIKNVLNKYNLPGKCLEIEITEGVLIDNIKDIQKQLDEIKSLGVKVAMDDFGTGYSSLSYLRKFNFDKVKIDREFVKDYPQKEDGTIAKIIINLSQSLGLKVIAEGVETEEQIKFLKENYCDQIQGYYYSPPVNDEQFESLLRKNIVDKI